MTETAAAPLDPKDQHIKDLEHEVDMLTNAGVIECAVRNKSVAEYMEHWEGRATKAEQALALRGEPVAWGLPNTAITGKKQALMMVRLEVPSDDQYGGALWVPLVLGAAVSGERVANEKRKGERRIDYSKAGMLNRDCKDRRRYIALSGERVREALLSAKQFIKDGVDLGYIKLPEGSDPVTKTLLKILVAIEALPLAAQPEGK